MEVTAYKALREEVVKTSHFLDFVGMESEEVILNNFLDKINLLTKDINRTTNLLEELDKDFLLIFNKLSPEHQIDFLPGFKRLIESGISLYVTVNNSSLQSTLKSSLKKYKLALDILRELYSDVEISYALETDETLNSLVDSFVNP